MKTPEQERIDASTRLVTRVISGLVSDRYPARGALTKALIAKPRTLRELDEQAAEQAVEVLKSIDLKQLGEGRTLAAVRLAALIERDTERGVERMRYTRRLQQAAETLVSAGLAGDALESAIVQVANS